MLTWVRSIIVQYNFCKKGWVKKLIHFFIQQWFLTYLFIIFRGKFGIDYKFLNVLFSCNQLFIISLPIIFYGPFGHFWNNGHNTNSLCVDLLSRLRFFYHRILELCRYSSHWLIVVSSVSFNICFFTLTFEILTYF